MKSINPLAASFRDPSGFVFSHDGEIYRQVNNTYLDHYETLMNSGLYEALITQKLMVAHHKVDSGTFEQPDAYLFIKPEKIPFISYPYEWCFDQLKDAALLTLRIQKLALAHGMTLKDASAYNIQFHSGAPIFIDTLSFETYKGGAWVAYKQFCQHFLGPLLLMRYQDHRLSQLLRIHIDGIPLDLASKLLPTATWIRWTPLAHIHLHARTQGYFSHKTSERRSKAKSMADQSVNKEKLKALTDQLLGAVTSLSSPCSPTEWGDYYKETNYEDDAMSHKKSLVAQYVKSCSPSLGRVIDLGANEGVFSRIALEAGYEVISCDIDSAAVEKNYVKAKGNQENILPLLLDLTNPSPALGWNNEERSACLARCKGGIILSLALIHHIALTNQVPLARIASMFSQLGEYLIIEFVPKSDSQVQRMLAARDDPFTGYNLDSFKQAFSDYYDILACNKIASSERTLLLMRLKT